MKIVFDHDFASDGTIVATHTIDTADPAVQAMLTSCKGNPGAQVAAGYGINTKMTQYLGQTRWQAVLGEVVRLNDVTARSLLGV